MTVLAIDEMAQPNSRLTEEGRKKIADTIRKTWEAGKLDNRAKPTPEQYLEIGKKVSEKLRGRPAGGRNKKGTLKHPQARHWVLRGPSGDLYEFENLAEWCRTHVSLFVDTAPESKIPPWKRAHYGIMSLLRKDKRGAKAYRGFEIVSVAELTPPASNTGVGNNPVDEC